MLVLVCNLAKVSRVFRLLKDKLCCSSFNSEPAVDCDKRVSSSEAQTEDRVVEEAMNRYNKQQKDKISQFRSITGASEKIAVDCLKVANWSLEVGIDRFYTSGFVACDTKAIDALFLKYKDPTDDLILADGMSRFCDDLEVDPSDIVMLVLSWHLNAATMCEYTRDEFIGGLCKLGCDSIDKLKRRLPDMRAELRDDGKFRDIYTYAYLFAREKNQKCLQLDTALAMWQLLFAEDRRWPLLESWCEFLQKHHNRAISKDTWVQLYDFYKNIKPDFSNFDENGAWPYLMDEFVDFMKQKQATN